MSPTRTDDAHLVETTLGSEPVYDGRLLHVRRDTVRLPDGTHATREHVVHPGAVMVMPLLPGGRLLLERQFRYPLQRVILEFPAGKIDPGEEPIVTARRELMEETGHRAAHWEYLLSFFPIVSYCNERIDVFLARGLEHEGRRLDDGEFLEVVEIDAAEALALARRGELVDGKTLLGLLLLRDRGLI